MKRFHSWVHSVYASEAGRWIAAAAVACALYLVAILLQPVITFYDNDDLNIAWALAGYRSGTPSFSHPFINCITAAAVSALYTAFPRVPWWYAVQTACMLLSVCAVTACTLKIAHRRNWPLAVPLAVTAALAMGTYYYALAQVMFTLSSTLCGMAACAMALAVDVEDAPARQRAYWITSVAFFVLSLLVRQSSGLCAGCFYAACVLYRLIADRKQKRALLRAAITALAAALCAVALVAVNAWGRTHQNPAGFIEFENARASYMDYPHDLQYENVPLYDAVEWDETLQGLVEAWFFMDERVNAETLTTLAEGSHFANLSTAERAAYAANSVSVFLGKYPLAVYLCVMAACAGAVLAIVCLRRRSWLTLIAGLACIAGGAVLLAFLYWQGRMNLRTHMTVLFPAILTAMLFALLGRQAAAADGAKAKPFGRYAAWALGCALALVTLFCGYKIFRTTASYDSTDEMRRTQAVAEYVIKHPENVYIRDVYTANNYDALTVYPEEKPTNLIDWGGCDMYTRARTQQWQLNGYDESPYGDVFLDGNVYYLCDPADRYLPLMAAYMAQRGAKGYEVTDTVTEGVAVVRFYN